MRTFTIGEVLNRLKDDFLDVTISKIRFLESEGLIHPDRTDSGYRKFTEDDVERLRYILRSQRDRYLPLKVIREELDRMDAGLPVGAPPPAPVDAVLATREPSDGPSIRSDPPGVQLSLGELCDATGLAAAQVRALRDHGLVKGDTTFDGDDLEVVRAAGDLLERGLEARHLRMYLQFADRELALYEQLITPLMRQRNPESRAAAEEHLDALARHGARLHRTLLFRELRALLRS